MGERSNQQCPGPILFEGFDLLESFTLLADAVTCGEQYDGHLKWQNNVITGNVQ